MIPKLKSHKISPENIESRKVAESSVCSNGLLSCAAYHREQASQPFLTLEALRHCTDSAIEGVRQYEVELKEQHLKWAELLEQLAR